MGSGCAAQRAQARHHDGMDAHDLYGLALDRFVAERGAVAKALRAEDRRDEAAEVASLRKPSIAAWAVNQLIRTQGRAVQALFDAGDALRGAQADLLAGSGDGRTLRAAGDRERGAVDDLVAAARGLLTSEGYELSAAVVERVSDTLHAAALDERAREQVREGCLERELRHVGLGLGLGEEVFAPPPPGPAKGGAEMKGAAKGGAAGKGAAKRETGTEGTAKTATAAKDAVAAKRRAEREAATAERAEAKRAERERAAARKVARTAAVTARRRAEAATRAAQTAQERRDRAAHALSEADAALARAREEEVAAIATSQSAESDLENA